MNRRILAAIVSVIFCLLAFTCSKKAPTESKSPPIVVENDSIPPAAITNLSIVGDIDSTCLLTWTAPGDDGNEGTASAYDIRYTTDSLTLKFWANAYVAFNSITPAPAGTDEQFITHGLQLDSIYFFGVKSIDDSGNISQLSNIATQLFGEFPEVHILSPVNGQSVADLVSISAIAIDNKGIVRVEFYIDTISVGVDIFAPYSILWDAHKELHGTSHIIYARATDTDNNISGSSVITCFIDTVLAYPSAPSLLIPTDISDTSITLTWGQNQDNDFRQYVIQIDSLDQLDEGWIDFITIPSITDTSYTILLNNNWRFRYRIGVSDIFGNRSYSNNVSIRAGIVINDGAVYAEGRAVFLTIVSDIADSMAISNHSDFHDSQYKPFESSMGWTLLSGSGTKTVYAKLKGNDGYTSDIVRDDIYPLPINPEVVINDDEEYTAAREVTLDLSAHGSNLFVKISVRDTTFIDSDWEEFEEIRLCTLSVGPGVKNVYAMVKNDFNIESQIITDSILPLSIAPSVQINNDDQFATMRFSELKITAHGSNIRMKISTRDSLFTSLNWEPFFQNRLCTLTTGSGTKTAYAIFVNDFEIISPIVWDQIEPLPMYPSITVENNREFVNHESVTVELELPGYSLDGGIKYKLSEDPSFSNVPNWKELRFVDTFNLSANSGTKSIHFKSRNHFEIEADALDSITLDVDSPNPSFIYSPDSSHDGYFVFDASAVRDNYTGSDKIEICWQFAEGEPLTNWTLLKTTTHDYNYDYVGPHIVSLNAKDLAGNMATFSDTLLVYNNPPIDPINPNPEDFSTNVLAPVVLSWYCNDPDIGDTLLYDVFLDTINPPINIVETSINSISLPQVLLKSNIIYYWSIKARDIYDASNISSHNWQFTTSRSFSMIAFSSYREGNWDIYLTDFWGYNEVRLTYDLAGDTQSAWSPDGTQIAFTSGDAAIFVMNIDGTNITMITDSLTGSNPSWSPNGDKIAYQSLGNHIILINPDGSDPIDIGPGYVPDWGPDGNRIVYALWTGKPGSPNYDIHIMNSNGTEDLRLTTHPAIDYSPTWSPLGDRILFHSIRDGNYEIYAINIDGSGLIRLTNNSAVDLHPDWSPDGSMIVFESDGRNDNPQDLYIINADGTNERQITTWQYADKYPAWSK